MAAHEDKANNINIYLNFGYDRSVLLGKSALLFLCQFNFSRKKIIAFQMAKKEVKISARNSRAKKLIVSRQPILINLKSNTMKNTQQIYNGFLKLQ